MSQGVQWSEVFQVLRQIQLPWATLSLAAFLLSFYIRANRWGLLINQPSASNTLKLRQSAIFIGFGSNCLFPFNAGELIRAKLVSQAGQLPLSLILGSIVSERLLDATTAFSLLALSGVSIGFATQGLWLPILGLGGILLALIAIFYSLGRWQDQLLQRLEQLKLPIIKPHWKTKLLSALSGVLKSFGILNEPAKIAIALGQSYIIWGLGGVSFWLMMQAFQWQGSNFIQALFVLSLQAIAAVIPSSPGHLGTFEAAMSFALQVIDIQRENAIAYTLIMRVMMYGSLITLGLFYALTLGFKQIRQFTRSQD